MKNLSLIINGILVVAVAVLYYLHFAGGHSAMTLGGSSSPSDLTIAYVNADTLLEHYDYLNVNRKQLEEKTAKMDEDYRERVQSLQNEYQDYQRNMNSYTIGQLKAKEEDLQKKQQNLQLYQQSLQQVVMNDQDSLNRELYSRVTAYLDKYGRQKGLRIVLKFDPTSDVLYADSTMDITSEVLTGLNEEYKAEHPGAKQPTTGKK